MNEVLRLLRISLLLRLIAGAVSAPITIVALGAAGPGLSALGLTLLPTALVLLGTFIWPRLRVIDERLLRRWLSIAIVALAIESAVGSYLAQSALDLPRAEARRAVDGLATRMMLISPRVSLDIPLVFSIIISMLGAWLQGQRGIWRWAGFAIVVNVLSLLVFDLLNDSGRATRLGLGAFIAQSVMLLMMCYFVGSLADRQRKDQEQLREANHQLAKQAHVREELAASRERVRLARDLHDTMAHSLAGLVVQLDAISMLAAGTDHNDSVRQEIERAKASAKQGLTETRAVIGNLRTDIVSDLGLIGALEKQLELNTLHSRAEIQLHLHGERDRLDQLDRVKADGIFRIAQEAMNNALRHADAHHVRVVLRAEDQRLLLSVKDDGVGFDARAQRAGKFGLRGMRERAELIGAHLRVNSVLGDGTEIELAMPLG